MTDATPAAPALSRTPTVALETTTRATPRTERQTTAERFAAWRNAAHAVLPPVLGRFVPPTAIGFAVLSSLTYATDLVLLALLFDLAAVPYPAAVTIGYVVAFSLSFVLNRWLNFQSHGSVSRQSGRFALTVLVNYLVFILVLSTSLEAVGVNYLVARLTAGACEAVFMYVMMRLYIFRPRRQD